MEKNLKGGYYFRCYVAIALALFLCTACGHRAGGQDGVVYKIYYVNNDETKIVEREYVSETSDRALIFDELLEQLSVIADRKSVV